MREKIKTILLFLLSGLLIFFVAEIWMQAPSVSSKTPVSQENFERNTLKMELLGPKEVVLKFSDSEQTLLYEIQPYWSLVQTGLKTAYSNLSSDSISKLTPEDYQRVLEDEKMIRLKFPGVLDHGDWAQLLGFNLEILPEKLPGKFLGIDLSLDKDYFVLTTDQGHLKVKKSLDTWKTLGDRVSMVYDSRRYRNYTTFREKYGMESDVYVARINSQPPQDIPLQNNLEAMTPQVQNNLARRYLRQTIDYIREISEENAVTYVYDQKVLRLNKNGWLTYKDGQKIKEEKEASLVDSLETALDFITSHTGMTGSLYISEIEKIETRSNPGYVFYFNMLVNHKRVYRLGQEPYFIRVEVHQGRVSQMDFLYQKPVETDIVRNIEIATQVLSPEEIIDQNREAIDPSSKSIDETLGRISWMDASYVEVKSQGQRVLKPVWTVRLKDRIFSMDMTTGQLILEG